MAVISTRVIQLASIIIPLLIRDEVAVDWVVGWKVLKVTRTV